MELSIAYYPMAKLLVFLIILGGLVFLGYKKKKWKAAIGIFIALAIVYTMIPVRIDGTKTHIANQLEEMKQSNKYIQQSNSTPKIKTKSLTFDEKMALIDAKNKIKNKAIEKEIYK